MELSQLRIRARQRSPWEAIDLGFVVARRWYWPLFWVWAVPSVSVFVLLLPVFWNQPWIAFLIWWWLKPLYDRLPLHIASRRLFGSEVGVRDTLKSFFSVMKEQWFSSLLTRRFSPSRSHDLPITCLEKLRGKPRQRRISVMHIGSGTQAIWLTVVAIHIETLLAFSVFSGVWLFMPEHIDVDIWSGFSQYNLIAQRSICFFSVCCACIVAPFYSAGGFMLYISRRIDLEAWDIEIEFRNLARKRNAVQAKSLGVLGMALVTALTCFSISAPVPALAQQPAVAPRVEHLSPGYAKELIEEVKTGEAFVNEHSKRRLAFKDPGDNPNLFQRLRAWWKSIWDTESDDDTDLNEDGFLDFLSGLGTLVKMILILTGLVLVGYIIFWVTSYVQNHGRVRSPSSQEVAQPTVLFGLEVTEDSLPDDVALGVEALVNQGDLRGAMALLFRSLLTKLMHDRGFRFYTGHTENECARIVQKTAERKIADFTSDVTTTWVSLAYAGNLPVADYVTALSHRWREVFDD